MVMRPRVLFWLALALAVSVGAQTDPLSQEAYLEPAATIKDIVTAPWHENVSLANLSPDKSVYLLSKSSGMPSLADYSKPYTRLGGLALDLAANRARSLTVGTAVGYTCFDPKTGKTWDIQTPRDAKVSGASWSPDGKRLAFLAHFEKETHAYVATVENGRSRRLSRRPVLATQTTVLDWTGDGKHVVTILLPARRAPEPVKTYVPSEPVVRVTASGNNRTRTYASLLSSPYDMALYEYMITGQLVAIDADSGQAKEIGKPSMLRSVSVGPNANFVRVSTVTKPFSYIVPVSSFGYVEELWNEKGESVHEFAKRNLQLGAGGPPDPDGLAAPQDDFDAWLDDEQAGQGRGQGRPGGPGGAGAGQAAPQFSDRKRNFAWHPDGRGMIFQQGQPARREDPNSKGVDRIMRWVEPYGADNVEVIFESDKVIGSFQFSPDFKTLFTSETEAGVATTYAIPIAHPADRKAISKNRTADFYQNPGTLMTTNTPSGGRVVMTSSDGKYVYLSGTQYFQNPMEKAPKTFVDRVEWAAGTATEPAKAERIFECADDKWERVTDVLDPDFQSYVVSRESKYQIGDFFLRTGSEEKRLTTNKDYAAAATDLRRERLKVKRADGFEFWVNVTLPQGWDGQTKPPAFFWFYPREVVDQATYNNGTRTYNKNTFRVIRGTNKDLLGLMGYAVIEPDCPIVGPTDRKNDKYVHDLRANLYAAINVVVRANYADRERLALGGHSYGAFGTANAMIHTPFFKAGIAGDGNYNRLLTPNGFQSEQRTLWEAREVYTTMSPLLWAEQMTGAMLMYHGGDDQNVGTALINSERMFHALNSLNKNSALYVYPYEDHGQVTRETILDQWARWVAWLDKYVKDAK